MPRTRKQHTQQTKLKVAMEAIKGQMTTAEITSKYSVHASQVNTWKKKALEVMPEAFSGTTKRSEEDQQSLIDDLYEKIGRLTVERDWLKKKSDILF